MLVRITNREESDLKKQSDLSLPCLSRPLCRQLVFEILEHLPYHVFPETQTSNTLSGTPENNVYILLDSDPRTYLLKSIK